MTAQSEAQLVRDILVAIGSRSDLRVWRMNTGAARDPSGRLIRFGPRGQPDIVGILAPHGRYVGIEAKSATGRQTADQKRFERMAVSLGGLYILARSVSDVTERLPVDPVLGGGQ